VVVVTFKGTLDTVTLKLADTLCGSGVLESRASAVKLLVPETVGVPVMAPVVAFRPSPAGRLPEASIQVTGAVPPVDARVAPEYDEPTCPPGSFEVVTLRAAFTESDSVV
jgi:hypothetical protein